VFSRLSALRGPGTLLAEGEVRSKRHQRATEDIMKSTLGIIGIATLALTGFSTEAFAEGSRGHLDQCLAAANLSYHQDRQIDGFRAAAIRQSSRLRGQIDRAEAELRSLTLSRRPNRMAIARKEAELHALRDRDQNVWSTYRLQVQTVLGPMQRVALNRCASSHGPAPVAVHPAPIAAYPAPVAARPAPIASRSAPVAARPARNSHPLPVAVVLAPSPRPMGR
jgi:Spy/CpxP family protein refolding chaperone